MATRENSPCSLATHLGQTAFWIRAPSAYPGACASWFPSDPRANFRPRELRGSSEHLRVSGRCVLGAGPAFLSDGLVRIRCSRRRPERTLFSQQRRPSAAPGSPSLLAAPLSPPPSPGCWGPSPFPTSCRATLVSPGPPRGHLGHWRMRLKAREEKRK